MRYICLFYCMRSYKNNVFEICSFHKDTGHSVAQLKIKLLFRIAIYLSSFQEADDVYHGQNSKSYARIVNLMYAKHFNVSLMKKPVASRTIIVNLSIVLRMMYSCYKLFHNYFND